MILKSWAVFTGLKIFTAQRDGKKEGKKVKDKSKEERAGKGENRMKIQAELGSVAVGRDSDSAATVPPARGHRDTLGKATSHHPSLPAQALGCRQPPSTIPVPSITRPMPNCTFTRLGKEGEHQGSPKTHTHPHTHTHPPTPSCQAREPPCPEQGGELAAPHSSCKPLPCAHCCPQGLLSKDGVLCFPSC